MVASFIRRISFENGDISKSILGEMRLCSRAMKWFSDRLLGNVSIQATAGQFDRHHLNYPSLTKTYYSYLASHSYHGLCFSRAALLGGERKLCPPQLPVHEYPSPCLYPHRSPYHTYLPDHPLLAYQSPPPFGCPQ